MGIIITITGIQPACNECGICLCWELSEQEYEDEKEFWDSWCCKTCNPNYRREHAMKKLLLDKNIEV